MKSIGQQILEENTRLRAEIARLRGLAGDITPDYDDKSDETDSGFEVDPETGKIRKKKSKKSGEEQEQSPSSGDDSDQDDYNDQPGRPDKRAPGRDPSSNAWHAVPASIKIAALAIVNSGRARRGLPLLSKLAQDEQVGSIDQLPTNTEERARAFVNAGRRARNMKPISASEWVSIRDLQGRR